MGNPLLKNESSSPYDQLHRPIRIAMTGLEASGKQTILASLASQDPTKPVIESESPTLGFTTHTLRSGPLRITAFDACPGYKQSLKLDTTTMRRNSDGVVFVIDCRDRARWVEAVEELKFLILNLEELRGAPLLVMANFVDAEGAMSVQDIERDICAVRRDFYSEVAESDERPVAIRKVDAKSGHGLLEAMMWMIDAQNSRHPE